MEESRAERFSEEVERYRRALVYFARQCDWTAFKERAARLFDYVEQVETAERERRFFRVFNSILAILTCAMMVVVVVLPRLAAGWFEHRQMLIFLSLAGCGFEFFFYLNFRQYVAIRIAGFRRRRERFIRDLERDFRSFPLQAGNAGG